MDLELISRNISAYEQFTFHPWIFFHNLKKNKTGNMIFKQFCTIMMRCETWSFIWNLCFFFNDSPFNFCSQKSPQNSTKKTDISLVHLFSPTQIKVKNQTRWFQADKDESKWVHLPLGALKPRALKLPLRRWLAG